MTMSSTIPAWERPEWAALVADAAASKAGGHIRDLLRDEARCGAMTLEVDGVTLDYARQLTTPATMGRLFALARATGLGDRIADMARGVHLNTTEDRAVLHMALRAPRGARLVVDGEDVVPAVVRTRVPPPPPHTHTHARTPAHPHARPHAQHAVLDHIEEFAGRVRGGGWTGVTGAPLTDVVSIGIGGSYLGPEFVFEALRHDVTAHAGAAGRRLRFLACVARGRVAPPPPRACTTAAAAAARAGTWTPWTFPARWRASRPPRRS